VTGEPTSPRAVVFDLDDTLADTSGTVLEMAHADAVRAMLRAGLRATFDEAFDALLSIREVDPAARFTEELVRRYGAPDPVACARRGLRAFFATPRDEIRLMPGALEVLRSLRRRGIRLFLLSYGEPAAQEAKVKRLGIRALFEAVRTVPLSEGPDKSPALADLLREAGLAPGETWLVGDRPDGEIRAGRELGTFTIRVRAGEFRRVEAGTPAERPDRTISSLPELLSLLPEPPSSRGC
jgi:FMN phosphatase YigB (HAD superfamily)